MENPNKKQVKYVIVCKISELLEKIEEKEKSIHEPTTANV